MNEFPWTGERLVTSMKIDFGVIEHLHRYALAKQVCHNKIVLDIACGEGYGSNLLSLNAKEVIGVDISEDAISHAKQKYQRENLLFKVGNTSKIPCKNQSIDVVVSFETIEHHLEHQQMFKEIIRVLQPNGLLVISSPEKNIYSSRDPNNIFHLKELELNELLSLVNEYFNFKIVLNQRFVIGSLLEPIITDCHKFQIFDGDFDKIENKINEYSFFNKPFFNIILCSNSAINVEDIPLASFFNGYKVYEKIILEKDKALESLKNSYKYKLGDYLLRPIILLRNLWRKYVQ